MRIIIIFSTILMLFVSCKSQQYNVADMCGTFGGPEDGIKSKRVITKYVRLKLNTDSTCSFTKSFDLYQDECRGEWSIRNGVIEIKCNRNPILSDIEKSLIGGCCIEGTLKIEIWSKNTLKWNKTILKRIYKKGVKVKYY